MRRDARQKKMERQEARQKETRETRCKIKKMGR